MGVVIVSQVSLVRAMYCTIGSCQYTLSSGRPVQTGQVLFEFKFTTAHSEIEQKINADRMFTVDSGSYHVPGRL